MTTFPVGGAEGLPVLQVDCQKQPFDETAVDGAVARTNAPGLWGVWLVNVQDWADSMLADYLATQIAPSGHKRLPAVGIRPIGAKDWPPFGAAFVLDVSTVLAECSDVDALADRLGTMAHLHPPVEDLCAKLGPEQHAPKPGQLDMLFDFARPGDMGYLYLPPGYRWRELVVRAASQCETPWAVRELRG